MRERDLKRKKRGIAARNKSHNDSTLVSGSVILARTAVEHFRREKHTETQEYRKELLSEKRQYQRRERRNLRLRQTRRDVIKAHHESLQDCYDNLFHEKYTNANNLKNSTLREEYSRIAAKVKEARRLEKLEGKILKQLTE